MKNCIILGSGRSGTSMFGGVLHEAGYFMGNNLYPGTVSNPKGFFESPEVNEINEMILKPYNRKKSSDFIDVLMNMRKDIRLLRSQRAHSIFNKIKSAYFYSFKLIRITQLRLDRRQLWLSSLPPKMNVSYSNDEINHRIETLIRVKPFCFKDPRYSYTLPVWKRFLDNDTIYLCVFREPDITVNSILKECATSPYLRNVYINKKYAYRLWLNIYSHILSHYEKNSYRFAFIHYQQILDGSALSKISNLLEVKISNAFADKRLKRSAGNGNIPGEVSKLYNCLCALADYSSDINHIA